MGSGQFHLGVAKRELGNWIVMQERPTIDSLYAIGFRSAARWIISGQSLSYEFHEETRLQLCPLFDVSNALYAFCRNDDVLYIGKTTQSLRRRMLGYCRPGQSQGTNLRCNSNIREMLADGQNISILVFTPLNQLQYAGFEINLAAGLEDSLIRRFNPPWNGGRQGHAITESAEIESAEVAAPSTASTRSNEIGHFQIRLGSTYYNQGLVNPGVDASRLFGAHDEALAIRFSDGTPSVATRIDRHANRTGAVRFVGSNQAIADWFQNNFQIGDVVTVKILGPNEVEFMKFGDERN
jgi:hypothetical protein